MNTRTQLEKGLTVLLSSLAVHASKTPLVPLVTELDRLTQAVLSEQNFQDDYEPEVHLKGGKELSNELNAVPEHIGPESLPLIADAAIRNLNLRLDHDLGLYVSDPAITSRLTGELHLHSFGTIFSIDNSPGELASREKALREHIQSLGLSIKTIEDPHRPGCSAFALDYIENHNALNDYFKALNIRPVYFIRNDIIQRIDISLPLDEFEVFTPPDEPDHKTEWTAILSEPDVFSAKKLIKSYLELLRISFQGETFRPIMEPEIPLNLFQHYMADIERILSPDLPVCKAVEQKHATARKENLAARDLQTKKGLRLLHTGREQKALTRAYQDLYAAMEQFVQPLGAELEELSLGDYGRIMLKLTAMRRQSPDHPMLDICAGERSYDTRLCNTERNWDTILQYFRVLDPNVRIEHVLLDRENQVKHYQLGLCDFQTAQRLRIWLKNQTEKE